MANRCRQYAMVTASKSKAEIVAMFLNDQISPSEYFRLFPACKKRKQQRNKD